MKREALRKIAVFTFIQYTCCRNNFKTFITASLIAMYLYFFDISEMIVAQKYVKTTYFLVARHQLTLDVSGNSMPKYLSPDNCQQILNPSWWTTTSSFSGKSVPLPCRACYLLLTQGKIMETIRNHRCSSQKQFGPISYCENITLSENEWNIISLTHHYLFATCWLFSVHINS